MISALCLAGTLELLDSADHDLVVTSQASNGKDQTNLLPVVTVRAIHPELSTLVGAEG